MNTTQTMSLAQARRLAVASQGLDISGASSADVLERLGCIQIDAMRPIRRSHELALLARGVSQKTELIPSSMAFETWGHAHSLLPVSLWPYLAFRRRAISRRGLSGPAHDPDVAIDVLRVIAAEGPKTLAQLDRAEGIGWDRHSPSRAACEWLLSIGELVCTRRDAKWQRIYALPEAEIPSELFRVHMSDDECLDEIVSRSLAALGVATIEDIADYFRISKKLAAEALRRGEYQTVSVEGSDRLWWLSPHVLDVHVRDVGRTVALSPLDNLVWTRGRQADLFGKHYLLEAYKPAVKRQFGYYALPILHGDRLVGRIAARAKGSVLHVEAFELDSGTEPDVGSAVYEQLLAWTHAHQIEEAA